jgi:D-arabinose 1-dehydrogenase-like Zn-dependent alcohol dehydrogenase
VRALRLHAPAPVETRPLLFEDVPDPIPGPGQILVKVSTCGICRTDLHVVGYRALRLTGLALRPSGFRGARPGLYGFGAAGHIAIQIARARRRRAGRGVKKETPWRK